MTDFHRLSKHEMYVVDFKTSHLYSFVSQPGNFSRGQYLQTRRSRKSGQITGAHEGRCAGDPQIKLIPQLTSGLQSDYSGSGFRIDSLSI